MSAAYLALLIPITALGLHGAVAHTWLRVFPARSRQKSAALVSGVNALGWFAWAERAYGLGPEFIYFAWTGAAFSFFYFVVWNCTETARRVRILISLYRGEPLSYTPELMIRERAYRLEAMGAICLEGDRYFARLGGMLAAAHFFRAWRRIFRCDELERYG